MTDAEAIAEWWGRLAIPRGVLVLLDDIDPHGRLARRGWPRGVLAILPAEGLGVSDARP